MLCNLLATPFLCCCHLIFLQPEPTTDFFGYLIAFGVRQISNQTISCNLLLKKNGDVGSPLQTDASNDPVLHMQQEGPSVPLSGLSECHYNGKCVKLHGFKLILLYYLAHIASVIFLSHVWWLVPVFSMV